MICSLTAYERPELLRQVLRDLRVAGGWLEEPLHLVARVEPSEALPEIIDCFEQMRPIEAGEAYEHILVNPERLGLQQNTYAVLRDAWALAEYVGEDFVLHLEDDLLLAPDALRLAAWMRDRYRDDDGVTFVGLTEVHNLPDPGEFLQVRRYPWFECHVWGTWRPVWRQLEQAWPHEWDDHWAARVNELAMFGGTQLLPLLSRSRSVGVYGQHCNPDYHARHNPHLYAGDIDVPAGVYFEADGTRPPL